MTQTEIHERAVRGEPADDAVTVPVRVLNEDQEGHALVFIEGAGTYMGHGDVVTVDTADLTPRPARSPHHVDPAPRRTGPQSLYVEAPTYYRPQPADPSAVFLAGGITGVERWHDHAVKTLQASGKPVVIINPNRARFPIHDPSAAWEQVSWEQHHLHLPSVTTLFWFPASDPAVTTQPIAMFELGQALGEGRRIVVGAHPDYPREPDVHMLCQLARPGQVVYSDLDHALQAVNSEEGRER